MIIMEGKWLRAKNERVQHRNRNLSNCGKGHQMQAVSINSDER